MKLSTRKGFTLIELLVVITIIGLLATMGIASFTRAQARGRDGRRQGDLSSLRNALELFYSESGVYVSSGSWQPVSSALSSLVSTYIKALPSDPGGGGIGYFYLSISSNQGYCLCTKLETAATTQSTCTVGLCSGGNYGVGNP